jgi:hypothetical protein
LLTFYSEQAVDSIIGVHFIYQVEPSHECRASISAEDSPDVCVDGITDDASAIVIAGISVTIVARGIVGSRVGSIAVSRPVGLKCKNIETIGSLFEFCTPFRGLCSLIRVFSPRDVC